MLRSEVFQVAGCLWLSLVLAAFSRVLAMIRSLRLGGLSEDIAEEVCLYDVLDLEIDEPGMHGGSEAAGTARQHANK